jgi:outer membrane protein TolC
LELAQRLQSAGNISDLQLATENVQFEQSRLKLARSETALFDARERLTRLMGLWGKQTDRRLPEQLPDLPAYEFSLEQLDMNLHSSKTGRLCTTRMQMKWFNWPWA